MLRRFFFLLPSAREASLFEHDAEVAGVNPRSVHALSRREPIPEVMHPANERLAHDTGGRLERMGWRGNLVLFALAAIALVGAVLSSSWTAAVIAVAFMIATFALGLMFVWRVPDTQLGEFTAALAHGETLVMLDAQGPRERRAIEAVERRHPEATPGGVGWGLPGVGL